MDEQTPAPFKQYFPKLSLSSYFWVVILFSMVLFGIIGYFVGIRVSELPSSSLAPTSSVMGQNQPTRDPNDDNDIDYSNISGSFVTEDDTYDQFVIRVSALQTSANLQVDSDNRGFDNPHVGIEYPYTFSRLDPTHTYVVSASACYTNPKTYALVCSKNITVTKCSGTIQGATCIIKGNGNELQSNGEVDFSLTK